MGKTAFAAVNLIMPVPMLVGTVGFMLGTGGSAIVGITCLLYTSCHGVLPWRVDSNTPMIARNDVKIKTLYPTNPKIRQTDVYKRQVHVQAL